MAASLLASAMKPISGREGGAGLWTKSDSVTFFDDVTVGPVSGP